MASFKEYTKRKEFIDTVNDPVIVTRLLDCIDRDHFWKLVEALGLK